MTTTAPRQRRKNAAAEGQREPDRRAEPVDDGGAVAKDVESRENLGRMRDELHSTIEALQSLNEELSTLNRELQSKLEEYQAVSNELTSLLTSTDIAVLFLDAEFCIRRYTPKVSELLEVIASDVGRPLSDLARKFDDPDLLNDAAQVLDRLVTSEREIAAGDRWFLRRITPYRTAENRIEGVVLAFVETTARRRAEEAMLQASRESIEAASAIKDQYLANVSHELRTPLSVILMWSKLLSMGGLTPEESAEAVSAIVRSADAQRRLIEDLLDTARIASGKLRVVLRPIEMKSVVVSAIDFIRPLALPKDIIVEMEVESRPLTVLGDEARLEQVVWILLHNAVKFTPEGGRIALDLHVEGDDAVLTVTDTGRGISEDFLPRLFQPFWQAASNDGASKSGLGLGLSIAKSLVQLHGGVISASSNCSGENRGSTFTVRLPLVSSRPAGMHRDQSRHDHPSLDGVSVVLVEDNPDTLRAIQATLEGAGARVFAYGAAAEALASFRSTSARLIVSDVNMPDIDGLEFLRRIRALEQQQQLPPAKAIALTAMAQKSDRKAALSSGYDAFLAKPADPVTLVTTAYELLNRGSS